MTLDQADELLVTYLSDNWTETPIAWPNVEPRNWTEAGQPLLPDGTDDYIAVRGMGLGSQTITVDGSCIRYTGQLFIASCVKDGTGVRRAKSHLTGILELLENETLSGPDGSVRLGTITGPVGYSSANGWYVEEVGLLYHFERYTP